MTDHLTRGSDGTAEEAMICLTVANVATGVQKSRDSMYGPILRQLRDSKRRRDAGTVRTIKVPPTHLVRRDPSPPGLHPEDFVLIVESRRSAHRSAASVELRVSSRASTIVAKMLQRESKRPGSFLHES